MKKKGIVLVCVTPQISCKKLIEVGAALAKEENATMHILSVFPKRQCYNPDLNALEALNEAAIKSNAAMTVCFSDNPAAMTGQYIRESNTMMVVTGFPRENSTQFITEFHALMPDVSLSMVDEDGTAYRITASENDEDMKIFGQSEADAAKNKDLNSLKYKIHF